MKIWFAALPDGPRREEALMGRIHDRTALHLLRWTEQGSAGSTTVTDPPTPSIGTPFRKALHVVFAPINNGCSDAVGIERTPPPSPLRAEIPLEVSIALGIGHKQFGDVELPQPLHSLTRARRFDG
jgi:hypothetical protein